MEAEIAPRFWAKVRKTECCWVWLGSRDKDCGYGRVTVRWLAPNPGYAHRLAWILTHGPIAKGLIVMHKCDNPICVNPDHLKLGTVRDNMQDRKAKGLHFGCARSASPFFGCSMSDSKYCIPSGDYTRGYRRNGADRQRPRLALIRSI